MMRLGIAVVVVIIVVLALGGYVGGWSWTGFSGNTLWDWLHLLVLPVVLALLPLWLKSRDREGRKWGVAVAVIVVGFLVLIVGGYGFGWAWTGFQGNTVWNWLELLVLPVALPVVVSTLDQPPAAASETDNEQRDATGTGEV